MSLCWVRVRRRPAERAAPDARRPFARRGARAAERSVTNGKLFMAGGAAVQPNIYVAHVYGTAKEMGFATGSLLKQEILAQYANFFDYLYNMVGTRRPSAPCGGAAVRIGCSSCSRLSLR